MPCSIRQAPSSSRSGQDRCGALAISSSSSRAERARHSDLRRVRRAGVCRAIVVRSVRAGQDAAPRSSTRCTPNVAEALADPAVQARFEPLGGDGGEPTTPQEPRRAHEGGSRAVVARSSRPRISGASKRSQLSRRSAATFAFFGQTRRCRLSCPLPQGERANSCSWNCIIRPIGYAIREPQPRW